MDGSYYESLPQHVHVMDVDQISFEIVSKDITYDDTTGVMNWLLSID